MAVIIGKISIEGGPLQDFLAQTQEVSGQPGVPAHPIYLPPGSEVPSHPIYIPGTPTHPIQPPSGVPTPPIYWGPPSPSHPIVLPPDQPMPEPPPDHWMWVYDDELGWVLKPPGSGGKPQPTPTPPIP